MRSNLPPGRSEAVALLGTTALLLAGCRQARKRTPVAPGILFLRDPAAGAQLLDVDLATAAVRPAVVATNVERRRGNFIGDAKTVREWVAETGALGGMNAGFFGDTYDAMGRRKQIVGLAVVNGKVVAPGAKTASTVREGEEFVRAALGFGPSGTPDIAWATGTLKGALRRYPEAVHPGRGVPWQVRSAVACGPRLFVRGERRITYREERLRSEGRLPRAFAAYDRVDGRPRHLVLGRTDAMEYTEAADFLAAYFRRAHGTAPHDALCLDGGASAQIAYREGRTVRDAAPTGVLVPTAILLLPK